MPVTRTVTILTAQAEQAATIRRGILKAANTTNAWIITDGSADGVGSLAAGGLADEGADIPCIGLVPAGAVVEHQMLAAQPPGAVSMYVSGRSAHLHRKKGAEEAAGRAMHRLEDTQLELNAVQAERDAARAAASASDERANRSNEELRDVLNRLRDSDKKTQKLDELIRRLASRS